MTHRGNPMLCLASKPHLQAQVAVETLTIITCSSPLVFYDMLSREHSQSNATQTPKLNFCSLKVGTLVPHAAEFLAARSD